MCSLVFTLVFTCVHSCVHSFVFIQALTKHICFNTCSVVVSVLAALNRPWCVGRHFRQQKRVGASLSLCVVLCTFGSTTSPSEIQKCVWRRGSVCGGPFTDNGPVLEFRMVFFEVEWPSGDRINVILIHCRSIMLKYTYCF